MQNAVQITDQQYRSIYGHAFHTWATLFSTNQRARLSRDHLAIQESFLRHPTIPRTVEVTEDLHGFFANASVVWGSSGTPCDDEDEFPDEELPDFASKIRFHVGIRSAVSVIIPQTETLQSIRGHDAWFGTWDNYIAVLALAWSYILSARWTEAMPQPCSMRYSQWYAPFLHRLEKDPDFAYVDVGDVSDKEARWWSAVLAPGHGWLATMTMDDSRTLSPWSIFFKDGPQFYLAHELGEFPSYAASQSPPSYEEACKYLNSFCQRHNIVDQSHAALSAVLLIPSAVGTGLTLHLPAPDMTDASEKEATASSMDASTPEHRLNHNWTNNLSQIDQLIAMSCHPLGIKPMLLSVFYEPTIQCNAVSPWLQGIFAAMNTFAGENPYTISRAFIDRGGNIASLWVGATILGFQDLLLQDAERGIIPFNLPSAAWSGTLQSFVQLPVSYPIMDWNGSTWEISRANESRLLFLSQSQNQLYTHVPFSQWAPFGTTILPDIDLPLHPHLRCDAHHLQYLRTEWDCQNDATLTQFAPDSSQSVDFPVGRDLSLTRRDPAEFLTTSEMWRRGDEVVSESETRRIFTWLRPSGWSMRENEIMEHEWVGGRRRRRG